jgi:hypothetical protein
LVWGAEAISPARLTVEILLMETGPAMALGSVIDGQDWLIRIF